MGGGGVAAAAGRGLERGGGARRSPTRAPSGCGAAPPPASLSCGARALARRVAGGDRWSGRGVASGSVHPPPPHLPRGRNACNSRPQLHQLGSRRCRGAAGHTRGHAHPRNWEEKKENSGGTCPPLPPPPLAARPGWGLRAATSTNLPPSPLRLVAGAPAGAASLGGWGCPALGWPRLQDAGLPPPPPHLPRRGLPSPPLCTVLYGTTPSPRGGGRGFLPSVVGRGGGGPKTWAGALRRLGRREAGEEWRRGGEGWGGGECRGGSRRGERAAAELTLCPAVSQPLAEDARGQHPSPPPAKMDTRTPLLVRPVLGRWRRRPRGGAAAEPPPVRRLIPSPPNPGGRCGAAWPRAAGRRLVRRRAGCGGAGEGGGWRLAQGRWEGTAMGWWAWCATLPGASPPRSHAPSPGAPGWGLWAPHPPALLANLREKWADVVFFCREGVGHPASRMGPSLS